MKLNRSLLKKIVILLSVLTPVCFALRVYTYWKEFNPNTGFFRGEAFGCTLFNIFALIVFFLCLVFSFSKKGIALTKKQPKIETALSPEDELLLQAKDLDLYEEEESNCTEFEKTVRTFRGTLSAFGSLFLAFSFLAFGIGIILTKENLSDFYHLALLAFAFFSGFFYLAFTFKNSTEKSSAMAFAALSPVLWCTLRLLSEYRDLTRFMNKSLYVGQFLFIITALVFFVYQAQLILGDEKLLFPNSYAFNLASLLFLGLVARVPALIAFLGDRIAFDLADTTSLIVDLAITVFAGIKLSDIFKNS